MRERENFALFSIDFETRKSSLPKYLQKIPDTNSLRYDTNTTTHIRLFSPPLEPFILKRVLSVKRQFFQSLLQKLAQKCFKN